MSARSDLHRSIDRPNTHHTLARWIDHAFARGHHAADEIFFGRHHFAKAQVTCRGRAV